MQNNKYSLLLFITFLVLNIFDLQAQTNSSSPYSRYGIGDVESPGFGKSLAMGGTGIAQSDIYEINMINPASNSGFLKERFLFELGMRTKIVDANTTNLSHKFYNSGITSIGGGFRINKFWAASFVIAPLSSIGYSIGVEDSVINSDYANKNSINYLGEGGLNNFSFANSFEFGDFSLGIKASYLFGRLNNQTSVILRDDNYSSILYKDENLTVSDFSFLYGLQYKYKNNPIDSLADRFISVGAVFSPQTMLNSNLTQFSTRIISMNGIALKDTLINDTISTGEIGLPKSVGFGFAYENKKILFGIDYAQQFYKNNLLFADKIGIQANSMTVSAGGQFTQNLNSDKFFERISYRMGARYSNTSIVIAGTQIKDYSVSVGAGIPLYKTGDVKQNEGTIINLSFEAGQRGTTDFNLIKENYYLVNINFNIGARWFVKRKYH